MKRITNKKFEELLDILEDKGIVGPGDGAKPREVYINPTNPIDSIPVESSPRIENNNDDEDSEWSKV